MTERQEKTVERPAHPGSMDVPAADRSLSRRKLMALAGGSVAAASVLAACGSDSSASATAAETSKFGDGDVGILNYALTLEHLEVDFYADLVKSNRLTAAARKALGKFGEEEEEHVSSLTQAIEKLGGDPAAKPKTKFSLNTDTGTLELASRLENLGAAAYLGQLPNIESNSVLTTVLTIHSVEGRHAAAINRLLKKTPTPDGAFAKPATAKRVLAAVKPFIVRAGAVTVAADQKSA
jgi:rubrerythrin